jgi:carbamoyltransferase
MSQEPHYLLSVSCGHDASATLLRDGEPAVSIAQERVDRRKHSAAAATPLPESIAYMGLDPGRQWERGFPWDAVAYCLSTEGIHQKDIDLFTTNYVYHLDSPFPRRAPFPNHHLCHAASVFYGSGFERAAIFVADYGGDTLLLNDRRFAGHERQSAWVGDPDGLVLVWRQADSVSGTLSGIGAAYSRVADYLFPVSDSEGKLMALSATGGPMPNAQPSFFEIFQGQVYVRPTGLFRESPARPDGLPPDMPHFEYDLDWSSLPPPPCDTGYFDIYHRNLAYKMQRDFEEALLYLLWDLRRSTGSTRLAIAGGVGLNCMANARILREAGYEEVYIASCPGDAGQSLGAALHWWQLEHPGFRRPRRDYAYLGKRYAVEELEAGMETFVGKVRTQQPEDMVEEVAERLAGGQIIGWYQGPSEFGPRALGARSILADPRQPDVIRRLNDEVKDRYPFQPIAPSVLEERCVDFFEWADSPFMSFGVQALEHTLREAPGIVHIDGSSRIQTVRKENHALYHRLIQAFERRTGLPIVANTSFNGKGEPIVETPEDALRALCRIPIDALALGPYLIERNFVLPAAPSAERARAYAYMR